MRTEMRRFSTFSMSGGVLYHVHCAILGVMTSFLCKSILQEIWRTCGVLVSFIEESDSKIDKMKFWTNGI